MNNKSALAIYPTHASAEKAIKQLQKANVDIKKLSIISRDSFTEEDVVGYYNIGNRVASWGSASAFCGGIWGMTMGVAFFIIPGIQPILPGGPIFSWLICALGTALVVSALSAVGAVLFSLGIPKNSALKYKTEQKVRTGKFVLVTHDMPSEVQRTKSIIYQQSNEEEIPELALVATGSWGHSHTAEKPTL
jgi:hypothetical protein